MTSNEKIIKIASELLRNYFSDGLSLNDARQFNEFRNYLEDVLGDEADRLFTAEVRRYVELAGKRVGDLVLPQKNTGTGNSKANETGVKNDAYYTKLIVLTLLKFFKGDGFHLGSANDCKKLRVLAGAELNSLSNAKIDALVSKKIKPFENVCYPISQKTSDQIRGTIKDIFQSGYKIIYYSSFFAKNQDWLVPSGIFAARFLKYRIQRFLSNLICNERYFEETSSELSECEKIKAEILNVWNPVNKAEISVVELADQTFVPVKKLEETLEYYEEFEKIGENWQIVPKDELESNDDVLLVNPFDYLPLSVATQEEEEERKRMQAEDVLVVHEDYEEPLTPEPTSETTQKSERTNESTPGEEKAEQDRSLKAVEYLLTPNDLRLNFAEPKGVVAGSDFILCRYRGQILVQDCSWNKLYVAVIKRLLNEYPKEMRSKLNQSLGIWDKIDFADQKHKGRFIREKQIADNFYVEGNNSAYDISKRIKASFDLCGIDINNIEIWYRKNKSSKKSSKNNCEKRQKRQKARNDAEKINTGENSDSSTLRVDFSVAKPNLAHTKPVSCFYQGEELPLERDWSVLYTAVISRLYKDYPDILNSKKNVKSGRRQRLFFADEKHSKKLLTPRPVARDFYVETHFSADDTVKKIKKAFELCGADLDDLEIYYRPVLRKSTRRNRDVSNEVQTSTDNKIRQIEVDTNSNNVEISDDVSVAKDEKKTASESNNVSKQEPENVSVNVGAPVDVFVFDYSVSYAEFVNTKPVLCVFRNEIIAQKCSWREAYCVLVQRLFREYSDILRNAANKPVGDEQKVDFADRESSHRFKKPFEIDENLYIESEPVAYELVQQIKRALNLCDVPFDDLIIWSRNSLNRDSNAAIQRTILELTERYGYDSSSMLEKCTLFANTPDMFLPQDSSDSQDVAQVRTEKRNLREAVLLVLNKSFQNGFSPNSIIDLTRLRQSLEEFWNDDLKDVSNQELLKAVSEVGEPFEDKIYIIPKETDDEIQRTIENAFGSGTALIFYDQLFDALQFKLPDFFSKNLLKAHIERIWSKQYRFASNYYEVRNEETLRNTGTEIEKISAEIKRVWGESSVVSYDELSTRLPYISLDKIKTTLSASKLFMRNSKQAYTRLDYISIEDKEKENALKFVEEEIQVNRYALLKDLPLGGMELRNEEVEPEALRKILFQECLEKRWRLNKRVITDRKESLTALDVVKMMCRNLESISLGELYDKVQEVTGELNYAIALETGYDLFVRKSRDKFVATRLVNFDVEKIDQIIEETIGEKKYLPLKSFVSFVRFPSVGFTWTVYLLESFCLRYSKRFKLNRLEANSDNIGVVERVDCKEGYKDVLTEVVAYSNIPLDEEKALNYLVLNGYLGRRRCEKINQIMKDAKVLRCKEES